MKNPQDHNKRLEKLVVLKQLHVRSLVHHIIDEAHDLPHMTPNRRLYEFSIIINPPWKSTDPSVVIVFYPFYRPEANEGFRILVFSLNHDRETTADGADAGEGTKLRK